MILLMNGGNKMSDIRIEDIRKSMKASLDAMICLKKTSLWFNKLGVKPHEVKKFIITLENTSKERLREIEQEIEIEIQQILDEAKKMADKELK